MYKLNVQVEPTDYKLSLIGHVIH